MWLKRIHCIDRGGEQQDILETRMIKGLSFQGVFN
jgi:hypothetical protein